MDKRAAKTRNALVEAMVELVREKGFDALKLGEILAAAGVGRSTFYGHYEGKDAFLVTSFVDMIARIEKAEVEHFGMDAVALLPAASLLHHVADYRDFAVKLAQSAAFDATMAAGEEKLRAVALQRLSRKCPSMSAEARGRTAVFVASAFIGIVRWWIKRGVDGDWRELETQFTRMVDAGLAAMNSQV